MTDDQLEIAARWLCVQRKWRPDDVVSPSRGSPFKERWKYAADEIRDHEDVSRAAVIANMQISAGTVKASDPLPAPGDAMRVRSENARRFDRILEDVEANKVPTWALQAAARVWCEPETRMIEMDSRLAIEFAKSLVNCKSVQREACAKVADRFDDAAAAAIRRME